MPFLKLTFRPGINKDQTNYSGEGGWWECDKIRFFSGFPQKLGGWIKSTPATFIGVSRQLLNWITSFTDNFLAIGTDQKLYIEVGGIFYDITPIRASFATPSTDNCIDTTNGSTTINVNILAHGCTDGDYVTISGVTGDPGGVPNAEINAEHVVTRVDADNFTFTVTTAATSTVSGGGTAIDVECQIHPGYPQTTAGYGWGTGPWNGNYGWGLASPVPVDLQQRDWFMSNFDNDMVANIRNGPIYYWVRGATSNPTSALATRAVLLSSLAGASAVPDEAMQTMVSQNDKHLLAFGCTPYGGGQFDPLLIRWASQEQPEQWTPATTNSAGFIRVSRGSEIVRALSARQEIVVWTNTTLYSLQFLGTTDVFGLQELADNISIIGPRGCASANSTVYWMGTDKFYVYNGQVQTLPCTLREFVFKNINYRQADQVICGTNEGFNEIWWFYPSAESNWVDSYVVYNHLENVWYYGSMVRTAWLDTPMRDYPTAVRTPEYQYGSSENGNLYTHEVGVNDDTDPMVSYIQSNDFDLGDGEKYMLTRRIIPDINFNQSTAAAPEVTLTVRPRNFPGSQYQGDPSDTQRVIESAVNIYTNQVFVRARARQMALKIASEDLNVQWQFGTPRLDVREDGKQ